MTPDQLWGTYIRPMGAGAVAAAGLITLLRTLPTIFSALRSRPEGRPRRRRRPVHRFTSRIDRDMPHALGHRWLRSHYRHDVDAAHLPPHPGRRNALVSQSLRRNLRHRLRLPLRHRRGAHQRPPRQLLQSHQRHEHRHADGHLRHLLRRRMDRSQLPGARADDRWRRLHRRRYRRRHFARSQDRLSRRRHSLLATDGPAHRRHHFHSRHRHHPQSDEQGPREIHSHPDSRKRAVLARRRQGRARHLHLSR